MFSVVFDKKSQNYIIINDINGHVIILIWTFYFCISLYLYLFYCIIHFFQSNSFFSSFFFASWTQAKYCFYIKVKDQSKDQRTHAYTHKIAINTHTHIVNPIQCIDNLYFHILRLKCNDTIRMESWLNKGSESTELPSLSKWINQNMHVKFLVLF